jgi:transposase InsO family protein
MELLRQHLKERPTAERSPTKLGEAVGLSRSTIWRQLRAPSTSKEDELELRSQIQTIALEMRAYGYRPITAELHRRGVKVNHKRVLRLLREDNLLCLRQRAFVRTTDSRHHLRVYPNLARDLVLSNINQRWVADISVPQQAVWKMEVGPPESAYRSRFQTTISGGEQKSLS